jgi:UDP-N-acetylmuramoyl-L-alanyl-D-glutamate--2,6-diaminopimelate ligase
MATLAALLDPSRVIACRGSTDVAITGVATDSRLVEPGHLFVCLPGYAAPGGERLTDRHEFAQAALDRGAVALIVERDLAVPTSVPVVRVDDAWVAAAAAAARFHRHPSSSLFAVGITGTSGKTSTSYFVDAVLQAAGHRVARMGTIDYRIGDDILPAEQTTPEAPIVQGLLRRAVDQGCTAVAMEVSSHALELRRVGDVHFDVAVFTNLSRDHLNFHRDMDSYLAAKARLFEALGGGGKLGIGIVNADDSQWRRLVAGAGVPILRYGFRSDADVTAEAVRVSMRGVEFVLMMPNGSTPVRLRHLGDYNVHNALAAAAVGAHLGLSIDEIGAALALAEPVPGRFEVVDVGQPFGIVVDYAHKPDALQRLLESARRLEPKRLITVVGCGGDRDRGKRPVMGRIAAELSDLVVVTSDNPRTEDPRAIIDDILVGSRETDPLLGRHLVEVDRAAAIRAAVTCARAGDLVVVAGKGHETYQLVAGRRFDFDDRVHTRQAVLESRRGT